MTTLCPLPETGTAAGSEPRGGMGNNKRRIPWFYFYMLTTPYHFSIVACSLDIPPDNVPTNDVLYRGSLPAARNLPFIRRLRLRSIIYLSKKQLAADDGLIRWAENREVQVKWIRVESMGEEGLGMGRSEVGEVLKVRLGVSCV